METENPNVMKIKPHIKYCWVDTDDSFSNTLDTIYLQYFPSKAAAQVFFCFFTFYYLFGTKFNQRWKIDENELY